MHRVGIVAVLSLALVAIVAPGVSASQNQTASFQAKANHATQGGSMLVLAKVKHATRGSTFSASAVVHFASGHVVVVDLNQRGRSFVARVRVPVAADEALGPVSIDVTITYNGVPEEVATTGVVEPPDTDV